MIVVAGVDGSPTSEDVVLAAAEQARWRSAELHIAHVTHLPLVYSEVPVDLTQFAEAEREAVWASLESVFSQVDVPTKRIELDGYPPDTLVAYTNEVAASLLVVGTRGRGEIASLILGSTAHRAIHIATCDVLVVKPGAEAT